MPNSSILFTARAEANALASSEVRGGHQLHCLAHLCACDGRNKPGFGCRLRIFLLLQNAGCVQFVLLMNCRGGDRVRNDCSGEKSNTGANAPRAVCSSWANLFSNSRICCSYLAKQHEQSATTLPITLQLTATQQQDNTTKRRVTTHFS